MAKSSAAKADAFADDAERTAKKEQARGKGFFSRLFGRSAPEPKAAGANRPAPPPAGPATHPDERGPEEREPGTRKKGTPDDPGPKKPPKQARKAQALDAPPPHAPHPIPPEQAEG